MIHVSHSGHVPLVFSLACGLWLGYERVYSMDLISWPVWRSKSEKQAIWKEKHARRPKKAIRDMRILEEAIEAALYYEEIEHDDLTIAACQRVVALGKDPEVVATFILKLGDVYFAQGKYKESIEQYEKLSTSYPGNSEVPKARYREIMAHFLSSLHHRRDQTESRTVIRLGKAYCSEYPDRPEDIARVGTLIAAAYVRLMQHELFVVDFYWHRYTIDHRRSSLCAAARRIIYICEHIIPQIMVYIPKPKQLGEIPEISESIRALADHGEDDSDVQKNELDMHSRSIEKIFHALRDIQERCIPDSRESLPHPRDRF